jgi:hypothetical protein
MVDHESGPHQESQGSTLVMNGHGKSDSLIVLEKLPNKGDGAPSCAEGVEGRGLGEGNLIQGTRDRTQWRGAL